MDQSVQHGNLHGICTEFSKIGREAAPMLDVHCTDVLHGNHRVRQHEIERTSIKDLQKDRGVLG